MLTTTKAGTSSLSWRPGADDASIEDDLNFKPSISIIEYMGLVFFSTSLSVLIGAAIGFIRINVRSGLGLGMMWAGMMGIGRLVLLETKYLSR